MPEDYQGGWAFTAPSTVTPELVHSIYSTQQQKNVDAYRQQQLQFKQQKDKELENQREQGRQARAAKFVGDNFKDANFATGTAADPLIATKTAQARSKFAKLIHDNPNMDEGELEMQMQQDLSDISRFSDSVKAGRKSIEEGAQHYAQLPGIDSDRLKQGAIQRMLYNTDDSGKKKLNETPDLTKDYLNDELQEHPDLYVQGDLPLMKSIENFKPKKGTSTSINEHAGVTTEHKLATQTYPWQELATDAKGNPTGLRTKSETIMAGGRSIPVVDEDTFQRVMTPGVAAMLKRDADDYIKKSGVDPRNVPEGSEAYKNLGRAILYKKLNDLTPSEYSTEIKKTNASFVDKLQLGIINAAGNATTRAQKKHEDDLTGSGFGTMLKAVNGDSTVIQNGTPYHDPDSGKDLVDITDQVGGFKTAADVKPTQTHPGHQIVQKLLVDPANPGKLFTLEHGVLQEHSRKDVEKMIITHAPANGWDNRNDINDLLKLVPFQKPSGVEQNTNQQVIEKAKAQKAAQDNAVFQKQGQQVDKALSADDVNALKGMQTSDGLVVGVKKNTHIFGPNDYSVSVRDAQGGVKTIKLGKKELSDYLKGTKPAVAETKPAEIKKGVLD
jgi:hypothetical protein